MSVVNPVKVDIRIEDQLLTRDGAYSTCFITSESAGEQDNYVVYNKNELITLGFTESSKVYQFASLYFNQANKPPYLAIRTKSGSESYTDAYLKNSNSDYLYIAIDSKNSQDINQFSEFIETQNKLFFTSSDDEYLYNQLQGRSNTVFIYNKNPLVGSNYIGLVIDGVSNSGFQGTYSLKIDGTSIGENMTPQQLINYFLDNGYTVRYFQQPL